MRNRPVSSIMWTAAVVVAALVHASAAVWWDSAVYYRILVDSFRDGDGDGLGDIKGLTKQLSYVKALGADAVILSPIVSRSLDCTSPGTMDFTEIDQRYGTLDGFINLLEKAQKLEMKVVITLPLRTVSVASEWFNSSAARVTGFDDRLVWVEGSAEDPPLPEQMITWSWNELRGAFFASLDNETLLNLCSEATVAALSSAQCAWIRRGVAGVLLNPDFKDQLCGEKLVRKMAAEAASCARAAGLEAPAILVETSLPASEAAMYYGEGGVGASSVISRALVDASRSAPDLAVAFNAAILNAPQDTATAWITSASYERRTTTRFGSELVDAINLLSLTLPGSAIIQQGDELGAADTILEWASLESCWPGTRVPSSAPFPWDDTASGGFTSGQPWLPLAPNYRYANAKAEFANDASHAGVVRVAAAMRRSTAMGPNFEIKRLNNAVAVLRWGNGGSLLAVANVGRIGSELQLNRIAGIPATMTVATSSAGSSQVSGSQLSTEKILKLAPGEGVLLVGPPRHCGGPGPVDKIASKLSEGWQKLNKYFS